MAKMGQLVYNLEDYYNTGHLISSDNTGGGTFPNEYFKVEDDTNDATSENEKRLVEWQSLDESWRQGFFKQALPNKLNIYSNLFYYNSADESGSTNGPLANQQIKKIGIQAPPGTKFKIGTAGDSEVVSQIITVGRNGIYELEDEHTRIRYLKFLKQYKWVLDDYKTKDLIEKGTLRLQEAWSIFERNRSLNSPDLNNENIDAGGANNSVSQTDAGATKEQDTTEPSYWKIVSKDVVFNELKKKFDEIENSSSTQTDSTGQDKDNATNTGNDEVVIANDANENTNNSSGGTSNNTSSIQNKEHEIYCDYYYTSYSDNSFQLSNKYLVRKTTKTSDKTTEVTYTIVTPEDEDVIYYYEYVPYGIIEDSWERYDLIFSQYSQAYEYGYGLYIQGINGVYKRIPKKWDDDKREIDWETIDPYNVIIDYISESSTEE